MTNKALSVSDYVFHYDVWIVMGVWQKDCGKCPNCTDMKKFGGAGWKKRACVNRLLYGHS